MISELFVLSLRGDCIIKKVFRPDIPKNTHEIFFGLLNQAKLAASTSKTTQNAKKPNQGKEDQNSPILNKDGVTYFWQERETVHLVAASTSNVSPSMVIDLVQKFGKILKDFVGVLNEETIRKNFILVYEILDEMVDNGYPQLTSTGTVKKSKN